MLPSFRFRGTPEDLMAETTRPALFLTQSLNLTDTLPVREAV